MRVLLYQVGRNLNRAYRTCEAFGVTELLLLDCKTSYLNGNLFKAQGGVTILEINDFPESDNLLLLETNYKTPLRAVDWRDVSTIVLGGETKGLPAKLKGSQKTCIPTVGKVSGLTVEAALAIALYEWRTNDYAIR